MAFDHATRNLLLATLALSLLPLLLQLPGTVAIAIALTALLVIAASWKRPLPGFLKLLVALVAVVAVFFAFGFRPGRDTGCALLAAMLALKPMELVSLRDARSLLGFALFAPFATFLLDQGPVSLVLGLAAALLALAAMLRLAELESGETAALRPRERLRRVGAMVAIGLPLALAAFWLFPRLATPLWGVPERALARPGLPGDRVRGPSGGRRAPGRGGQRSRAVGDVQPVPHDAARRSGRAVHRAPGGRSGGER